MIFVNITHTRPEFHFLDEQCVGRKCFHAVIAEGGNGLCEWRRQRGCPDPLPEFDEARAAKNRGYGWRVSLPYSEAVLAETRAALLAGLREFAKP